MTNEELTQEKLKLEIQELKRHWLRRPQYLQVLMPTTLAIFSLIYAITSGLFSSKQELLELNKKRLETDISAFQKEKETLILTNNKLKSQIEIYNDSLHDRNLVLRKYENSFTKERQKIQILNAELITLKNTRTDYSNQIAALEQEYSAKKQKYLKEIESKYYKEIDNDKKVGELQKTMNDLKETVIDLNHSINLLETNPFVKNDKKFDFMQWYHSKKIEYYQSKRTLNMQELEQLEKKREMLDKHMDTMNVKHKVQKIK